MTPKNLVRIAGLEPARLAALPPQSSVSANSTISATRPELKQPMARTQVDSGRFAQPGRIGTLQPTWAPAGGAPVSDRAFSVRDRTVPPDRRSALRWQCQDPSAQP